jgi:hypothetical protein
MINTANGRHCKPPPNNVFDRSARSEFLIVPPMPFARPVNTSVRRLRDKENERGRSYWEAKEHKPRPLPWFRRAAACAVTNAFAGEKPAARGGAQAAVLGTARLWDLGQ